MKNMNQNQAVNKLKNGIILIFIANAINLLISLANGFIMPKYLSFDTYADIKTYQLYANYIGVLALGYSDGLYLRYGGKEFSEVKDKQICIVRGNLIALQGIMTVLCMVVSFLQNNYILFVTSLSIIPVNLASAYKNIFQATGEFKMYSKILNYTSIITFIGCMFFLFVIKTDKSYVYIYWYIIVSIIIWILMEIKLKINYGYKFSIKLKCRDLYINIKSGIVLMLGNFSSILMTSIDRWFVKALLTSVEFAYYSFVVSVENLIAIFITPVVTTMYNYICITHDVKSIKKIKDVCLVFAMFLISSAYPAKFILEVFLTKYYSSKNILFILFATEVFYILIKGIYINIYKAKKQQKKYLKQLISVTLLAIILNYIAYKISPTNESIAIATLISVIVWYIVCCVSVKEIKSDWKENLFIAIDVPIFIMCGCYLPSVIGFILYVIVTLVLSIIFMKDSLVMMINMIKKTLKISE